MSTKETKKAEGAAAEVDAEMMAELEGEGTTAVAPVQQGGDVSTFTATGAAMNYKFVLVGNAKSEWKTNEGKRPEEGSFYLRKTKECNFLVGDVGMGQDKGIVGILMGTEVGWKENPKGDYNPMNKVAPKRFWTLDEVHKAGLSEIEKQVGTWPESGRPKMKADVAPFCYLKMLMQLPDDFESMDFQVFKVGDHLYTPVIVEFDRGNFQNRQGTGLSQVLGTWRERAEFAHRAEKDYKFEPVGQVAHIYSMLQTSKATGFQFTSVNFEAALRDGKLFAFTDEESADWRRVIALTKPTTVADSQIVTDE